MRRRWLRLVWLWLVFIMLMGQTALAAAPGMNAAITEKNILSLLNEYDRDSAYILKSTSAHGSGFLTWWTGSRQIVDAVDVGVHEEFHELSYMNMPYNSENIYIGNGKSIQVPITRVFRSSKAASTMPADLRTQRWSLYVGNPEPDMASDVQGVYGLLNEFTAYYWGMHAQLALFPYFQSGNATPDQWRSFVNQCANDRLAYAEFKYYMLKYMLYAKQHSRSVYNEILSNQKFLKAYQTIEKSFASQIRIFEKRLKDISNVLKKKGYRAWVDGNYFYISSGSGYIGLSLFQNEYDRLCTELKKAKYQNILQKAGTVNAGTDKKVGTTSISSAARSSRGITLKWKKASHAEGYSVYRKAKGAGSYKKIKTTSALSWTDLSAKKGKEYSYKIVPYAKDASGVLIKGKTSAVRTVGG